MKIKFSLPYILLYPCSFVKFYIISYGTHLFFRQYYAIIIFSTDCEDLNMETLKSYYTLHDGSRLPKIGFGTYKARRQECYDAVREALKTGYRHIDTAAFYENEREVGAAIRDSGIPRSEIFLTTKVWFTDQGYDKTCCAFEKSLSLLDSGYIDLYLIHWPIPTGHAHDYKQLNAGSWRAMTEFIKQGCLKSAGVSNFLPQHIDELMESSDYLPVVNQIECHPGLNQDETVDYCRKKGIAVEAWRPLLQGNASSESVLTDIAKNHGCTAAQVCISWLLARGLCPLPKSVTPARIRENAEALSLQLTKDECDAIALMPSHRLGAHPLYMNK